MKLGNGDRFWRGKWNYLSEAWWLEILEEHERDWRVEEVSGIGIVWCPMIEVVREAWARMKDRKIAGRKAGRVWWLRNFKFWRSMDVWQDRTNKKRFWEEIGFVWCLIIGNFGGKILMIEDDGEAWKRL